MKRGIIFLITIISSFFWYNNTNANYEDFIWGTPYNFYKAYTYTWTVISDTFNFTWQSLFIKKISCRNLVDLNSYNSSLWFWITQSPAISWTFSDIWNLNDSLVMRDFGYYTLNVNNFYSWSVIFSLRTRDNTALALPSYTWSIANMQCFLSAVLFDTIPNMNANFFDNLKIFIFSSEFIDIMTYIISIIFVIASVMYVFIFSYNVWFNFFKKNKNE